MPRPRPRRRFWLWGLTAAVLIIVVAVFGVVNYVRPSVDPIPSRADAIIQLGGVPMSFYAEARQLAARGVAPDLVLSDPVGAPSVASKICAPIPGVNLMCFKPDPSTTQGEAQEIGRLARARGWKHIVVFVTAPEHVTRVRYIVSKCYSGELDVAVFPTKHSVLGAAWQWVYQTGGWIKALPRTGC